MNDYPDLYQRPLAVRRTELGHRAVTFLHLWWVRDTDADQAPECADRARSGRVRSKGAEWDVG